MQRLFGLYNQKEPILSAEQFFYLYTDSKCLINLQNQPDRLGKYTRYKLFLADFNFEIRHKKGSQQPADIFSTLELPTEIQDKPEEEEE